MPRTDAERKAWARGYNSRQSWPAHIPPAPPDPLVADALKQAKVIRDWLDSQLATGAYEERDVGPMIDAFDRAMIRIGEWIRSAVEAADAK